MSKRYSVKYMDFVKNKYSEEEIRKAYSCLSIHNWIDISEFQKLSEDFIREFQNKISWYDISYFQKMSEDFIREFQDKVDWFSISLNEKLQVSDKFCEEFDNKLYDNFVWRINGTTHRTLGPAFRNEYWYRGTRIKNVHSMEEYKRWLRLRIFA